MPDISKNFLGGYLVLCALLAFATPTDGATFNVNSVTDLGDSNPGDGICSAFGVYCTLRAAVEESNALGGSHTINLPADTYLLTQGELAISSSVNLLGTGYPATIVDGNHLSRVFSVDSNATVMICDLTVRNGVLPAELDYGGGIYIGEGSSLRLENVVVNGNTTPNGWGGGVTNFGALTILRSTISQNESTGRGGGILNYGTLTATRILITDNVADIAGGGIASYFGSVDLTDVTITGNQAINGLGGVGGGGIFLGNTVDASLNRVTVDGNTGLRGGAIQIWGSDVTMTNVTLSGNEGLLGGGAISIPEAGPSNLTLVNVTIAGNLDNGYGGGAIQFPTTLPSLSTVIAANTIIADNGIDQCDSNNQFFSFGHNLETTDTCGLIAAGDLVNTPAGLADLADNGGFTMTRALISGSAAVDSGDDLSAPATDQRGVDRPQDGDDNGAATSDIGAFEVEEPVFADGFEIRWHIYVVRLGALAGTCAVCQLRRHARPTARIARLEAIDEDDHADADG